MRSTVERSVYQMGDWTPTDILLHLIILRKLLLT